MPGDSSSLLELLGEIEDLSRARRLLRWDERTKMPPRGGPARAQQLATLTRLGHERLSCDELGRLIERLEAALDGAANDSFEASLARRARRDWEKARRVPAELKAELAHATSIAEHAWERAREESDFAALLPHLERVIGLKRRYIECFDNEHPYDALLDDFEPDMRTAQLQPVLAALRSGTIDLLARLDPHLGEVDAACLEGDFPSARQEALAHQILTLLPLEPDAWRMDETVHPFALALSISDLRITTRFEQDSVSTAIWAVIHEAGHAIYQNGIATELERTPLCRSASLGFDESQSRLWENWVGRGRPFLGRLLPLLADAFPERFAGLDGETLYRAANRVARSPIRMDADEVTYNLHIAMRFELELALFEGRLAPADLPRAWNELSESYLGVEVVDDAHGVLQDVHWASGSFGYFPTYSLGNLIAARLWELAGAALPDLDAQLAAGELGPLRDFLAARVYRHGGKLPPAELLVEVTGEPLDPGALLRHLERKFGAIYALA
jgi:carboxypeptidase Taq